MAEPERERESELGSRGEKGETRASHHYFYRSKPYCRRRGTNCCCQSQLLVILNCCTVVAAVLVIGIELRVLIAEFYGCCIQHQGATSSPELLLLRFLDYSIELRLCLEVVAAVGTVGIDAVAVG
ncbi:uncharacterized protein DS421_14g457380 [Arachis hypogaea]|nr:uncharacterized protein DS421_14g457380 [Arachis hypogaea]